jgi:hypothetical protein
MNRQPTQAPTNAAARRNFLYQREGHSRGEDQREDAAPELKAHKERETNETLSCIIEPRTSNSKQHNASK